MPRNTSSQSNAAYKYADLKLEVSMLRNENKLLLEKVEALTAEVRTSAEVTVNVKNLLERLLNSQGIKSKTLKK